MKPRARGSRDLLAQFLAGQIRPTDPDLLHDAMNADQF